jgi:hypothetical protein
VNEAGGVLELLEDATRCIRSRDYVQIYPVTVTGTPTDKKGKEVEGSYGKADHVLVGNGNSLLLKLSRPGASLISQDGCRS